MNSKEYIELAIQTENQDFDAIRKRCLFTTFLRLDHASKGMQTEVGEFTDVLKKYEFYGKDFDVVNLVEELGDLLWYVAIACDAVGTSFEEIMERNIAKLKARYGEKFNEEGAINRDLENERNVLENDYNLVHWLENVETLEVLCGNKLTGDKYTLDEKLLTCTMCKTRKYSKEICGND